MKRVLSIDLPSYIGQRVRISGWLHALRSFGKIYFLVLRDRKGLSQVIVEDAEVFTRLRELQVGSVLTVLGDVSENDKAQLKVEIVRPEITIDVAITTPPSIEYVKPDIPYELDFILYIL